MLKEQHFNNLNLKTVGKETRDEESNWTMLSSQFWLTHGVYAHVLSHFSCIWLFANLWTIAHQAPLSTAFSRHEYWSGLPCPTPKYRPNPGIKPGSPALQADSLPLSYQGSPYSYISQFSCSLLSNSVTPWTAACQVSLSITNSWSLLKLMSIKSGGAIQPSHPL